VENVVDRLRLLSTIRCDISTEIIGHRSLRLENEDSIHNFINKGIKTNGEIRQIGLLLDERNEQLFRPPFRGFYEIKTSMWAAFMPDSSFSTQTRNQQSGSVT
jgi:hypothetical protein